MVYFLPLFLLMLSALVDFFYKSDRLTTALKFSLTGFGFLFLFYLSAFKGNIDPDYDSYLNIFNNTPSLTDFNPSSLQTAREKAFGIEYGILFIIGIIKSLGGSYQLLILFFSLVNIFLISKISRVINQSKFFIVFALVALFYQGIYIQIRFATSCFFLYLAIFYFLNYKKTHHYKFKAFISFLIGALLHNIWAIVLFLPLVMRFHKFIVKNIVFLFILTFPLSFLAISELLNFIVDSFFNRYNTYLLEYEGFVGSKFPYFWRLIMNVSFFYLLIFREKGIIKKMNMLEMFLLVCLFLNLASWAVGYNFPILYRVSWFFDIGYIFFILSFSKSNYLFKKVIFFTLFSLYLFYRVSNGMDSFSDFYFDWV